MFFFCLDKGWSKLIPSILKFTLWMCDFSPQLKHLTIIEGKSSKFKAVANKRMLGRQLETELISHIANLIFRICEYQRTLSDSIVNQLLKRCLLWTESGIFSPVITGSTASSSSFSASSFGSVSIDFHGRLLSDLRLPPLGESFESMNKQLVVTASPSFSSAPSNSSSSSASPALILSRNRSVARGENIDPQINLEDSSLAVYSNEANSVISATSFGINVATESGGVSARILLLLLRLGMQDVGAFIFSSISFIVSSNEWSLLPISTVTDRYRPKVSTSYNLLRLFYL